MSSAVSATEAPARFRHLQQRAEQPLTPCERWQPSAAHLDSPKQLKPRPSPFCTWTSAGQERCDRQCVQLAQQRLRGCMVPFQRPCMGNTLIHTPHACNITPSQRGEYRGGRDFRRGGPYFPGPGPPPPRMYDHSIGTSPRDLTLSPRDPLYREHDRERGMPFTRGRGPGHYPDHPFDRGFMPPQNRAGAWGGHGPPSTACTARVPGSTAVMQRFTAALLTAHRSLP